MLRPYKIAVTQAELDDLARRLAASRLPPSPERRGWEDGTNLDYLAELVAYWRDDFDWRLARSRGRPRRP